MLGRLLSGVSASAVAAGISLQSVAHADTPKRSHAPDPVEALTFAPVYDNESKSVNDNVLPGTIEPSQPLTDSKLARSESEIARRLDVEEVRAEGRVFKVSKLLQGYMGDARRFTDRQISTAEHTTSEWSHRFREGEREFASTVAGLKAQDEDMLPGAIYVLVAGLFGSIVARRRTILLRATVPWVFGGAAFAFLLPKTWNNVRQLAWKYEQEQVPTIARKHEETTETLAQLKNQTVDLYDNSEKQVKSSVNSLRSSIRKWTGF